MIATVLGGIRRIDVEGETLHAALADAFARHPGLKVHVQDETGAFREHVLCFLNDQNSRWNEGEDPALSDGDVITILQAVSGG